MNTDRPVVTPRRPLLGFFALSLAAWVIWLPQGLHRLGLLNWAPPPESPLNALTVWAPGLAALFLTWRLSGRVGVASLFSALRRWRLPLRCYAVALLLPSATWALAFVVDRLGGSSYPLDAGLLAKTFAGSAAFMVPLAVLFTLPNALGEELGWRAFALPRLQTIHGPLVGSVLLGLFWGFWHLPAWMAWEASAAPASPALLLFAVLDTVPVAVLFTWLFNRSGGSLLLACLYHAAITNTGYFLPELPSRTEALLTWCFAAVVVLAGGLAVDGAEPPSLS